MGCLGIPVRLHAACVTPPRRLSHVCLREERGFVWVHTDAGAEGFVEPVPLLLRLPLAARGKPLL